MIPSRERRIPTCFDCIHAEIFEGEEPSYWEPGEPDRTECRNEVIHDRWNEKSKIFEELDYDESLLPNKCGHFQPEMIENCSLESCQKVMNVPKYNWKYWATDRQNLLISQKPVCSEDCRDAIEVMSKLMCSIEKSYE